MVTNQLKLHFAIVIFTHGCANNIISKNFEGGNALALRNKSDENWTGLSPSFLRSSTWLPV